jgi:parallel beta-helix repeat protein
MLLNKNILAIGIVFLFVCSAFIPMSHGINTRITREQPSTLNRGKTLYVGGTGAGNYTKIQDAIDNATDEDTVYVFDESSPYLEKIIINKSINIFGENPNTVIIDGSGNGKVVDINVDWVYFRGFTIRHGDKGIVIHSNYSIIINNNINLNNEEGIYLSGSSNNAIRENNISENEDGGIYFTRSNSNAILGNTITSSNDEGIYIGYSDSNTITGNTISGNPVGIVAGYSSGNTIKGNNITNNEISIGLVESSSNTITGNTISGRIIGIYLKNFSSNTIEGNNITNSRYGIYLWDSMRNNIFKNNFLGNEQDVYFRSALFSRNRWKQNYWNRPQILPKLIFGYVVIGSIWIPWVNIDWRPALRPYDISVFRTFSNTTIVVATIRIIKKHIYMYNKIKDSNIYNTTFTPSLGEKF